MAQSSTTVRFQEITPHNIKAVLSLEVSAEQKATYPRSNAYSIAEGHYPADEDPVWMRAIYAGETPVGFIMTSEAPEQGIYFLWRLMIDHRHQGMGYGKQAVRLLIKRIRAIGNPQYLLTSHLKGDCDAGDFDAGDFYQSLGFAYTREVMNGIDHMMRIDFMMSEVEK